MAVSAAAQGIEVVGSNTASANYSILKNGGYYCLSIRAIGKRLERGAKIRLRCAACGINGLQDLLSVT